MSLSKSNVKVLMKTIIVFIIYLFYTKFISTLFNIIGLNDSVMQMFIADLLFLFGIIIIYKDSIKKGFLEFKNNYKISKKITVILKWTIIILVVNMIMGMVTELLFPEVAEVLDDNSNAIYSLFDISSIYTIFKTMIFAVIAEELVFKKSIRDIFKNNILFVVISGLIYVMMNFAYADLSQHYIWLDMFGYFLFAVITSIAYIKNNDNIFIVMLIKFFYNLIPLTILLIGVGL